MPRPLTRHDYRTLALAALGGALEFYDFVIYVFLAPVIGRLFFPAEMPDWLRLLQTFGIFSAGYLARPLGGIVIAHFGDLLGRKRMFTLSIFLMAVPTLAIGLLPTYASIGIAAPLLLLLMRILQGVAIGGEVPGAWVFVAEHVPRAALRPRHRHADRRPDHRHPDRLADGRRDQHLLRPGRGRGASRWRIPFIAGGVFGFVSVYLRRFLAETPVFQEMKARRALAREVPIKTVLRDHRAETLLALALTWVLTAAIVVVILFTPTYLQQVFHVPARVRAPGQHRRDDHVRRRLPGVRLGERSVRHARAMIVGFGGLLGSSYLFYSRLPDAPVVLNLTYALTGFFVGR